MKEHRIFRQIGLCMMLVLASTVLVGTVGSAALLQNRQVEPIPESTVPPLQELKLPEPKPQNVELEVVSQEETEDAVLNILLIGQDADGGKGVRSDTMILCTFNKPDRTIIITSFLRDLYVTIPGHHKDRINAAYAYGGVKLLEETLRENFDVEVDGYVQVDFDHFREIIDLLGGVTIDLTEAEARSINKHVAGSNVAAGENLLDGQQALAYVRNRKDVDGDFSRTKRQRKLLHALVQAYKSQKLPRMIGLLGDILPMINTDISKAELTGYAMTYFPLLTSGKIKTQSIPVEDGFKYAQIDGKAVLLPDMEKNKQALKDVLS